MEGYTGRLMEQELFGVPPKKETLEKLKSVRIRFKDGLKAVRDHYEDDPSDPEAGFANDLHATLAEKMGLDDYGKLRFYSAVGTVVDSMGVDGFFDLEYAPGRISTTTLDVTINPNKEDGWKADIIILVPKDGFDPKDERDAYLNKINEIADQIVDKFEEKRKLYGKK